MSGTFRIRCSSDLRHTKPEPGHESVAGLRCIQITLSVLHARGGIANQQILPPGFAQTAFIKVNDSQTERKKLVDEARKQESAIHKEAETEALVIRNEALQYRTAVVSRAQADAARVRELSARFTSDPEGLRIYLDPYRYDRLRSALAAARLYFLRDGQNVFWTSPSPEYMDAEAPEKKGDGE